MKKSSYTFSALLSAMLLMSPAGYTWAGTGNVTVKLLTSDNLTGHAGGSVEYYSSGWQLLGTTDASGTVSGAVTLTGNSTNFQLKWYGGTKSWANVDVTSNPTLIANTIPVIVRLETCAGGTLAGKAYWNAGGAWGGYNLIGITPASTELLPGVYTFRLNYSAYNGENSNFTNTKNQDISNPIVVFNTTRVTGTGMITYYENSPTSGWVPFTSPSEMLPNTVSSFKFGSIPVTIALSGCSIDLDAFNPNPTVFTITASAGPGGNISPSGAVTVGSGGSQAFLITTSTGHSIEDVVVNGSSVGPQTSYTFNNVTAHGTIAATFAVNVHTLTYTTGPGGAIAGTTQQTVNSGGNGTEVIATPNAGYHFVSWSDAYPTAARVDLNVTANVNVTANFAVNIYTLTYTAGTGGTLSGISPQTVNYNESGTEVTATSEPGYHFVNWSDGVLTASRTDANVIADLTVTANFALNTYELTVISALGGSITTPASLPAPVNHGEPAVIAVTPAAGYTFNGWIVETGTATITDASLPSTTVTVTSGNATVKATFSALPGLICGTVKAGIVPLENVKVELRDGNGELVEWIYTNATGYYCFADVNPDNYQILIVKPLGYAIDPNYQDIVLSPAETESVNFVLTSVVLCNRARDFAYWKHQFETHRCRRQNWQERLDDLNRYIAAVHTYYTPHFPIFADLTDKDDWEDLFTMRSNHPMRKKAIKQLAALVMNFVSLKIGQNTIVTRDNKTAGDVLTYVSQLVTNNNPYDDNLARNLAKKVNDGDKIASGIVPDGSILYKGGTGYQHINWGFDVPVEYALEQNYPNPFNPSTIIRFAVPVDGSISLVIFNTLGQEVAELMNGTAKTGTYEVQFNASNLASGLYFYRVMAKGSDGSMFTQVRKMLLMK